MPFPEGSPEEQRPLVVPEQFSPVVPEQLPFIMSDKPYLARTRFIERQLGLSLFEMLWVPVMVLPSAIGTLAAYGFAYKGTQYFGLYRFTGVIEEFIPFIPVQAIVCNGIALSAFVPGVFVNIFVLTKIASQIMRLGIDGCRDPSLFLPRFNRDIYHLPDNYLPRIGHLSKDIATILFSLATSLGSFMAAKEGGGYPFVTFAVVVLFNRTFFSKMMNEIFESLIHWRSKSKHLEPNHERERITTFYNDLLLILNSYDLNISENTDLILQLYSDYFSERFNVPEREILSMKSRLQRQFEVSYAFWSSATYRCDMERIDQQIKKGNFGLRSTQLFSLGANISGFVLTYYLISSVSKVLAAVIAISAFIGSAPVYLYSGADIYKNVQSVKDECGIRKISFLDYFFSQPKWLSFSQGLNIYFATAFAGACFAITYENSILDASFFEWLPGASLIVFLMNLGLALWNAGSNEMLGLMAMRLFQSEIVSDFFQAIFEIWERYLIKQGATSANEVHASLPSAFKPGYVRSVRSRLKQNLMANQTAYKIAPPEMNQSLLSLATLGIFRKKKNVNVSVVSEMTRIEEEFADVPSDDFQI